MYLLLLNIYKIIMSFIIAQKRDIAYITKY